jgi:hypothetical protein
MYQPDTDPRQNQNPKEYPGKHHGNLLLLVSVRYFIGKLGSMPSIGQIASPASIGLGTVLPLVTSLSNPVSAAIAGGVELLALIDKIGQGRKAANKFTQNGGPQDIINKQLAAISSSAASAEEKAQATEKAWTDFLGAANQFAAANPKQATVVKQAIYKTPDLTNTVQSLMGKNPLDASFTNLAAEGMATGNTKPNPGPSVAGTLLKTGLSVGLPFAMDKLQGVRGIGAIASNPGGFDPETGEALGGVAGNVGGGSSTLSKIVGAVTGAAGAGGNGGATQGNSSLLSRLLPTLISSGTSLLSGAIGARAAGKAADVQADAATEAARLNAQAGKDALQFNKDALAQQQRNIQPWIDAGTGALRSIGDIVNAPGYGWTETYKPPTYEEAMMDPGIQFQLNRGQQALQAYERANGTLLSGKAVKDIQEQAMGIAATGYGDVNSRKLQTYNTNYNTFANERSAKLNPELSLAGLGQTSVGQINSDVGNAGAQGGNIALTTANRVGDQQTNAAAARASGYVGSGNAIGGAVANVGNNILNTVTIQDLLKRLGGNA